MQNPVTTFPFYSVEICAKIGSITISWMKKTREFYEFRKALSARMAELMAHGIGTETRQAEPVTQETENILWEKGLLGNGNAKSLLNFVFFYNCKLFALRTVDEHKNLSIQQLELGEDQNGYYIQFTGRANKTYKGKTFYLIKEIIRISDCIEYFIKNVCANEG